MLSEKQFDMVIDALEKRARWHYAHKQYASGRAYDNLATIVKAKRTMTLSESAVEQRELALV